jgi:hypothetical protein
MPSSHIVVVLDRSGSMDSIRDDVIGGFNAFLSSQKAEAGQATLTLVQFDSQDPFEVVHDFLPIGEIPPLDRERFVPRGGTPLLDALGRTMLDLEARLAALAANERPERVLFATLTDGMENSSREFQRDPILHLIKEKTDRDGWQFVFLSADVAAIQEAVALGVSKDAAMVFDKNAQGTAAAFRNLSRSVTEVRRGKNRRIGFAESEKTPAGTP